MIEVTCSINRIAMKQNWKVIVAFAVIYLVWGTTYLAIIFAIKDTVYLP